MATKTLPMEDILNDVEVSNLLVSDKLVRTFARSTLTVIIAMLEGVVGPNVVGRRSEHVAAERTLPPFEAVGVSLGYRRWLDCAGREDR